MRLGRVVALFEEIGGCGLVHLSSLSVSLIVTSAPPVIPAKAGIQYSKAAVIETRRCGALDRPVKPDDDGIICDARIAISHRHPLRADGLRHDPPAKQVEIDVAAAQHQSDAL